MTKVPVYKQIEAHLRSELPKYAVGDPLPKIWELCELFNVNGVSTVRNAYRPLVEEGLVTVQQKPERRWVLARVPEARPENPLDAAREDLDEIAQALRGALARVERIQEQLAA